jgi:hypothetical protein
VLNPKQIEKRIFFCQAAPDGEIDPPAQVVTCDESRNSLCDGPRRMQIQKGISQDRTDRRKETCAKGLMSWGAIGKVWKSKVIFISPLANAQNYQDMLSENNILESLSVQRDGMDFTLYCHQESGPAHVAKSAQRFIKERLSYIPKWPLDSPDLSVIEIVWKIRKMKIAKRNLQSFPGLKRILADK